MHTVVESAYRDLINWSETDEKSRHGLPLFASGCKINLVVDNGKIVRAEERRGKPTRVPCV